MPKDPTKNIDRYKIGGDHLNEFEFHQQQQELAEQSKMGQENFIPGTPPQERADQVQQITEEAAQIVKKRARKQRSGGSKVSTKSAGKKVTSKKTTSKKSSGKTALKRATKKTAGKKAATKKAAGKKSAARKTAKKAPARKSGKKKAAKSKAKK